MGTTRKKKLFLLCIAIATSLSVLISQTKIMSLRITNTRRSAARYQRNPTGILIVGSGLSGAVLAHLHATILKQKVLVIEKRDHVGGNCYDFINEHGIRVSKYGAHLFHTNNKLVWRYLSQFSNWIPYEHRVVGRVDDTFVPIPVNIDTVNTLFNKSIKNQQEMSQWLKKNQIHNDHPQNGEEAAKARVGEILYDKLFKHYTYKQWEKFPKDLDASVLQRIPVRDNFDDRYFPNDIYQALPGDGYTAMITRMLNHSLITVKLNSDFFKLQRSKNIKIANFRKTFFTGPIDAYFASSGLEKLEYRSIKFETIHLDRPIYQPNVVVNYPQEPEQFTRIVEYKHLYNQVANGTTIVREYSSGTGDPYYPVPNERNRKLYAKYSQLAKEEQKKNSVYFVGRLASYKYFNMDQAVLNAINEFTGVYANVTLPEEKLFTKTLSEAEDIFRRDEGKSSIAVVISHCTENLTWISEGFVQLCDTHKTNIFIYEKCNSPKQGSELALKYPECNILQTALPNVGREGNTWLYHMMMKQSTFSDINVFAQGGKEETTQNFLKVVERMKSLKKFKNRDSKYSEVVKLQDHYVSFGRSICFDLTHDFMGWDRQRVEHTVCDYYYDITRTRDGCLKFMGSHRGEFVVTDVLLRRKLATYRNLMTTWYADLSVGNDPIQGHFLERFWTLFFKFPIFAKC
ncbi:UDP-galactopyranose mutase-like [Gigantopelta aegis]|uniref:UDP-galactopyranose mutase-like n=1 Tax=Gigantopelta aegis TaxID=1735272 RepID=UPI001B88E4CB|nr:UDP-galactopyranose mutase-like [Gigantopelta aegis]